MTPPLPVMASSAAPAGPALFPWLLRLATRGAILVMVVSIVVFIASLEAETWEQLRGYRWPYTGLLLGLVVMAWWANGLRTWLLVRVLGHTITLRQAVGVTLATEFATAATPGGFGGIAARMVLQRRLGLRRSETASMLAADVTADLVFFAALWSYGALALVTMLHRANLGERLRPLASLSPWWWVLAGLLGLGLLWAVRRHWRRRRGGAHQRRAARRRSWRRFCVGLLRFWRHGKTSFLLCCLLAAVQWSCRYGVLPCLIWTFRIPVEPVPLMLLQGLLFFLSVLVVLPGGGGSVEVLAALVLPLLMPSSLVGPVVIIWRLLTYHLNIVVGGTALWRQLEPPKRRPERFVV